MVGKVETRTMSEEERLAYIKQHPVVKRKRPSGIQDYKWRSEKATEARYGKKPNTAE